MDYDKLSAAIINLPCVILAKHGSEAEVRAYKVGHRDARHAAAELVNESAATPSPVPADTAELPPLPNTNYNGYSDGSEPLYTADQMRNYARAAIASRPAPVAAMTVEQARRTGYGEGVRRAALLVEQAIDNEGRMALAARIRDLQSATPAAPSAAQAAGVDAAPARHAIRNLREYLTNGGVFPNGAIGVLENFIDATTPSEGVAATANPPSRRAQ